MVMEVRGQSAPLIRPRIVVQFRVNVTEYISERGIRGLLDSAYLTRRNSQTKQIGSGERPRMYTVQTQGWGKLMFISQEKTEH